jgi:hypothetical protein
VVSYEEFDEAPGFLVSGIEGEEEREECSAGLEILPRSAFTARAASMRGDWLDFSLKRYFKL